MADHLFASNAVDSELSKAAERKCKDVPGMMER